MHRFLFASSLLVTACGGSVAPEAEPTATKPEPTVEWTETASCDVVASSCGSDPAVLVRGHAAGLVGLDGARVEFAIRYIHEEGMGLDVPHGVALGRTHVAGGAFETCVCVPHGANMYPQVAAVVYRPGATTLTGRDAERATFSQRYATLGDEDVSFALNAVPNDFQKEAAVAAMVERTAKATLDLPGEETGQIYAGLIADERPVAAQLTTGSSAFGRASLTWSMPGRAWSSERVAFFIDRNANGKCDADGADVGAVVPFAATLAFSGAWVTGGELASICAALRPDAPRE